MYHGIFQPLFLQFSKFREKIMENFTVIKIGPLLLFQCDFCEVNLPSKLDPNQKKIKPYNPDNGKFVEKCPYCKGGK